MHTPKLFLPYHLYSVSPSGIKGYKKLQHKIEQVSVTKGDGLGFDVLSYNTDGSEKHIEVKTTTDKKNTPFHISQNELLYSKEESSSYWLYRVYDLNGDPKIKKYQCFLM